MPAFVEEITAAIESKGLDMDGIYRISGNLVEIQKMKLQVQQGKYNFKDFDIHVLCGALKTYLRELDEPLIPDDLYQSFIDSISKFDLYCCFSLSLSLKLNQMAYFLSQTIRIECVACSACKSWSRACTCRTTRRCVTCSATCARCANSPRRTA